MASKKDRTLPASSKAKKGTNEIADPPARDTSVPARSRRTPTIPRLSKEDKTKMTEDGRAAFIALPKSHKSKRMTAQALLHQHVAKHARRGLVSIMASGDSYLTAVIDTGPRMLSAIETLKGCRFKVEITHPHLAGRIQVGKSWVTKRRTTGNIAYTMRPDIS